MFGMARLANITKADRVLTIDDSEGAMATFARVSGAANVESLVTDKFVSTIFNELLPGVADKLHAIDDLNLAREWQGKRPTAILMHTTHTSPQKIDEAMKVLAARWTVSSWLIWSINH